MFQDVWLKSSRFLCVLKLSPWLSPMDCKFSYFLNPSAFMFNHYVTLIGHSLKMCSLYNRHFLRFSSCGLWWAEWVQWCNLPGSFPHQSCMGFKLVVNDKKMLISFYSRRKSIWTDLWWYTHWKCYGEVFPQKGIIKEWESSSKHPLFFNNTWQTYV